MTHEWTLNKHIKTFAGFTPWVCVKCWAIVDTMDHLLRLKPCVDDDAKQREDKQ